MDVDKITGAIHSTKPAGHEKARKDKSFAQVLDRTMDMVHANKCSEDAPVSASEVAPVSCSEVSSVGRPAALQRASNLLDLMEEYAQALSNPRKTLRSIEPIVLRMQQALKGLDVQSLSYQRGNDELARLVNQISVTASVEAFKFQRGDYIGDR
ncbi:MAG: hypothetical protein JW883_14680 [Deltaproteobacteria bacterium]|nr:hypothetical protein [Deltaproteobacteria bacterium]